jgi:predicted polyphosphate/ATP-dependent NAD kinase
VFSSVGDRIAFCPSKQFIAKAPDFFSRNTMRLGFIVNPIAGMGGRVGLKGTDGIVKEAVKRGAKPIAARRAVDFLQKLKEYSANVQIELLTCPGVMGEKEVEEAGLITKSLPMHIARQTTAADTEEAIRLLKQRKADLIVFVGGDGTARDILDAMQGADLVPVLGVPSGVKMYSGIFATTPSEAADVVLAFARKEAEVTEVEIMDADEQAIREDVFIVRLYGFLRCPFFSGHVQGSKQVSPETIDERDNQVAVARFIVEEMRRDGTYILGPGTTVKRVAEMLGVEKTVLGIDIYRDGRVILDVDEKRLLREVKDWPNTWIILSPIGRQGILLGRGNQQISPTIIRLVGKERIIVAATRNKLQNIEKNVLRVDTGDAQVDDMLRGFIRVVTDYREWRLVEIH